MGFRIANNRYVKPTGYHTSPLAGAAAYLPFNGYIGGGVDPRTATAKGYVIAFSAAPTDTSQLVIIETLPGGNVGVTFTYDYAGSPGPGVIPLVAGGGTAAQAATATLTALQAQLQTWTVTQLTATSLSIVQKQVVNNVPTIDTTDVGHITLTASLAQVGTVLPGRFGKNYCFLSNGIQ